jgi:hypothetical protein
MNAVLIRRAALARHRLLRDWRRQGVSLREIARRLNVAPKTVRRSLEDLTLLPDDLPPTNDPPPGFDPANIRRCRTCGALVYLWPCLACAMTSETSTTTNQGATCHVHP